MVLSDRPFISMVLIARNEQRNVKVCLDSFWDAVDEVVFVDTGSSDGTVKEAEQVARDHSEPGKLRVAHFPWRGDFAAARNHAHSLATGEWHAWADLDDTVEGMDRLREIAKVAPADVTALMCDYDYAQDPHGNCICTLKRERLLRADRQVEWVGRVHEAIRLEGNVQMVPPDVAIWRHRKKAGDTPTGRNLAILERWATDEPSNGRVIGYLGTERAGQGKHEEAVDAYKMYLGLPNEPSEHRAQVWYKLACSYLAMDNVDGAWDAGLQGLAENPAWPDCYLTLARCAHMRSEHEKAVLWAQEVLDRGMPQTLLIVNPLDYTVEPRVPLAASLVALGRLDEAVRVADEGLKIQPDHRILAPSTAQWRGLLKRQRTAETWLAAAQMLIAHDEQQKALDLLKLTTPYFVQDEPRIVQARSELRERLAFAEDPDLYAEHYGRHGSRPEDMVPDEKVIDLCERLPRAQLLARQVEEMLAA